MQTKSSQNLRLDPRIIKFHQSLLSNLRWNMNVDSDMISLYEFILST
jgi:hypothetical protein